MKDKSTALIRFQTVLESYWGELPIEVRNAWERYENETGTYNNETN